MLPDVIFECSTPNPAWYRKKRPKIPSSRRNPSASMLIRHICHDSLGSGIPEKHLLTTTTRIHKFLIKSLGVMEGRHYFITFLQRSLAYYYI
jgi:hypothetical protein